MTNRPRAAIAAALLALAAAACGSSGPTQSAAVNGAQATPATATATPSATPSPSGTTSQPAGPLASLALPSFDLHAAPDLEAQLPTSIGSQQLQKYSFSFAQLAALGGTAGSGQTFQQWLQALGKNPSDVSVAIGSTTASPSLTVGAMRVSGADQGKLMSTFQDAARKSGGTVTTETLGGKQVVKLQSSDQPESSTYAYAKGDVMFFAEAPDDATATTLLEALP